MYFSTSDLISSIHTKKSSSFSPSQIFAFCLPRILVLHTVFWSIQDNILTFSLWTSTQPLLVQITQTVIFIYKFVLSMWMLQIIVQENPMLQTISACLTNSSPISSPRHQIFLSPHSSIALWHFPLQNTITSGLSHMNKHSWPHVPLQCFFGCTVYHHHSDFSPI